MGTISAGEQGASDGGSLPGKDGPGEREREDVRKQPVACSGRRSGREPEGREADGRTGNRRGAGGVRRQSKLVGPVLRATRRHRGLPTEKGHDRVLHVSGLCSTVREPGEAGRRGTR